MKKIFIIICTLMITLDNYNFDLPKELIASAPATPRDSARLFIYDTESDTIIFDTFANIDKHLPKPSLLVFNDTKVIPARLLLTKEIHIDARGIPLGGGKVEVLLMMNEFRPGDSLIKGIVDRKISTGEKLFFKSGECLEVIKQEEQFFFFKPSIKPEELFLLLEREGVTPIPPYIKNTTLSEDTLREKYQSVLAKHPASIAAPTASLHFTDTLLERLTSSGIQRTEITLHVGAGTFAPITAENFVQKKLFTEYLNISDDAAIALNDANAKNIPVIPVGTTAMRTLESAVVRNGSSHAIVPCDKATDIFIFPPYDFRVADAFITNFHVPRSSLILLVDAFLKYKGAERDILALYDIAIKEKFRFYSFGDSMLIL